MTLKLTFSANVENKLGKKHGVSPDEVRQCFSNMQGKFLQDTREDHATDPPTLWFIAETDHGRLLKVCFVFDNGITYIKTAYEPNKEERRIYQKHGQPGE